MTREGGDNLSLRKLEVDHVEKVWFGLFRRYWFKPDPLLTLYPNISPTNWESPRWIPVPVRKVMFRLWYGWPRFQAFYYRDKGAGILSLQVFMRRVPIFSPRTATEPARLRRRCFLSVAMHPHHQNHVRLGGLRFKWGGAAPPQ